MDITPDGSIFVVASACCANGDDISILKFLASGDPDPSFSGDGRMDVDVGSGWDRPMDVVATAGRGATVSAWTDPTGGNANYDPVLLRVTSTGALDGAFGGGDGIVTTSVGTHDMDYAMTVQPDGRIVLAGYTHVGVASDVQVARYTASGEFDSTFASDGVATASVSSGYDVAWDVAVRSTGQIVVAGATREVEPSGFDFEFDHSWYYTFDGMTIPDDVAVLQFGTDGALDTSFADDGISTYVVNGADDSAHAMTIDASGRIVLAGAIYGGASGVNFLTMPIGASDAPSDLCTNEPGVQAAVPDHQRPTDARICVDIPWVWTGSNGDDVFVGGDANDRLKGGRGNDRLHGGGGNDNLRGGQGNDRLSGDAGNDDVDGETGNDALRGGTGRDRLKGGRGNDTITGNAGRDSLGGGIGNDVVDARDGAGGDDVVCGPGRDAVRYDRGDRIAGDCENRIKPRRVRR